MTVGEIPSAIFSTGLTDNKFNINRDKIAAAILDRMIDLMATEGGIVIDSTAESDLQVVDAGGGVVNIKAGSGYDKFGQRLYLAADDAASGLYVGTVDLSSNVDLSTNHLVKIDIDDDGATEIDCVGATPAATTIDEIVAAINAAGFGTIAFRVDSVGNPVTDGAFIMVKSSTTGGSSEVEFVAPSATDATNEIFGLSEGAYPHTYNGGGGYAIPDSSGATPYDVIIEYLSVESVTGNFEGGYPSGDDSEYTELDDSYKVTVQLSSVGPINDADQHELWLAQVTNDGGVLTILDKRGDIMLRLKGQRQVDITSPPAPVLVNLWYSPILTGAAGDIATLGRINARWEAVTDSSGIREYIVKFVLTEQAGEVVVDAAPHEYVVQGFDQTADEVQLTRDFPLGNKYDVLVAAKDNSLSQNISAFTDLGNIQVGSGSSSDGPTIGDDINMPAITVNSITNGVAVDWPAAAPIIRAYEFCWAFDGQQPEWRGSLQAHTTNSDFVIPAAPGRRVKVRVRIRRLNMDVSNESIGETTAGGTIIGLNEKSLLATGLSVDSTDDGKTARFLLNQYLPNAAKIVKLVIDVKTLTLDSSEQQGLVRVYRSNEESGAVSITFGVIGQHEIALTVDNDFTAGLLKVDAYDIAESGGSQAAFTADMFIIYAEGVVVADPSNPPIQPS